MPLTSDEINKYKPILQNLLPKTGAAMGNMAARNELQVQIQKAYGKKIKITTDDYWKVRDALLAETPTKIGIGKGRGGAVYLLDASSPMTTVATGNKYKKEDTLYVPVEKTINDSWVKHYRIEHFKSEITAKQGSKLTGGKWTRPDITLFAVRHYPYINPSKSVELITFEIKTMNSFDIGGVYEAASHTIFAHRSYLMIHTSVGYTDDIVFDKISKLCERFGVGFVTFEDPADWDTYNVRIDAALMTPDPYDLCEFIGRQLSTKTQSYIKGLM